MTVNIYRILDANFNRAREAARILEDFARFQLDDVTHTKAIKGLRHSIAELSTRFGKCLITSRDVTYDIGKNLDERDKKPRTFSETVTANFKRLEESLRSIEEYSRIISPAASNEAGRLRFSSYTLEKEITAAGDKRLKLNRARLYILLTKGIATKQLDYVAREAIAGGADIIQLRGEGMSDREFIATAKNIRAITETRGIPFIINNRVDIAKAVGADGAHLGSSDMPIEKARKILGIEKIIGATTHNVSEASRAVKSGADYISVGPMFASMLKPSLQPMGFSYINNVKKLGVPFFCIGGITSDNVHKVVKSGGVRIAVCSGVTSSKNIRIAAMRIKRQLK